MARIYPFRAWRYNPSAVRLEDVVTQPYDKISPAMQQAYYQRSPYNLVRIILGLPELFDAERSESVYTRAVRDFRAWRDEGVLAQEKQPCVLAYAQRFAVPGADQAPGSTTTLERRGFIALGRLHEYADQVVFRHEQTLAKPKSDRLNLLRATRAHFGQIFMLYSDPARTVETILFDGSGSAEIEVTDEYGVVHRVWRISDPATIRLLATAMADKKLIIADGHHRYETALDYRREHLAAEGKHETSTAQLPHPPFAEAAAMMTFVNMDSDGLVILPTHRVIHKLEKYDIQQFLQSAGEFFDIDPLSTQGASGQDASELMARLRRESEAAFVAVTRSGDFLLRAKPQAAAALENVPERLRQLDLTHLHALVLERLLGLDTEKVREETNIRYLRDAAEAVEQARRGDAQISFLTKPVTMEELKEVAFAGEVMPQKSTDFYPKLLSGLAIYALD